MLFGPTLAILLSGLAATASAGGFTGTKVIAGYWPSYGSMPPSQVPYKAYTHLDYFVFITTPQASAISTAGIPESTIYDFVSRAHRAGITTSYVIGGWTGSKYFSTHVATAFSRQQFAQTLVATMNRFGFDGIDIDWEYPGSQGIGDNIVSPNDAANFALFLATLRNMVPNARLSLAVSVGGVVGPDGNKLTDLRSWVPSIDYLTIMSYDMYGPWAETTGPNSQLYDTCSTAWGRFSGDRAVNYYTAAGFAKNHILMGFPAYSYTFTVTGALTSRTCPDGTVSNMYQERRTSGTCGNWIGDGIGQLLYRDIVANQWFPPVRGRTEWQLINDPNSRTAALYSFNKSLFIPTETIGTAKAKSGYVLSQGLAGLNTFSIEGDTANLQLVNAQRAGFRMRQVDPALATVY